MMPFLCIFSRWRPILQQPIKKKNFFAYNPIFITKECFWMPLFGYCPLFKKNDRISVEPPYR